MSRNLCSSSCVDCGYSVSMSDLRGCPIEFRRYSYEAPSIGCRFDCKCGKVYFAIWRHSDKFWGKDLLHQAHNPELLYSDRVMRSNEHKGRFYKDLGSGVRVETGVFTIDLSYYYTYNDEESIDAEEAEAPAFLFRGQAEEVHNRW